MAPQRSKAVFTNWFIRVVVSILPVLVLLIGISNVLRSNTRALGVVALVVGAYLTYRAVRSASIVVDDEGVVVRGLFRTRRIQYPDLQRAATNDELDHGVRRSDAAVAPRIDGAHLVLYLKDGDPVRVRSLRNSNHRGDERPSRLVEDAVDAINARIPKPASGATT
jgi:hypothetical protein